MTGKKYEILLARLICKDQQKQRILIRVELTPSQTVQGVEIAESSNFQILLAEKETARNPSSSSGINPHDYLKNATVVASGVGNVKQAKKACEAYIKEQGYFFWDRWSGEHCSVMTAEQTGIVDALPEVVLPEAALPEVEAKKKGRPALTKSEAEIAYVRNELMKVMEERKLGQHQLANIIGVNQSNISKFLKKVGWTRLSDASIESLYDNELIARPSQEDLQASKTIQACAEPVITAKIVVKKEVVPPVENYTGEARKVSDVSKEKGYTSATIRRYCLLGKLNYIKRGSRYWVCCDEKLDRLEETELATLRKTVAEQAEKINALQQQVESLQLQFTYEDGESVQELAEANEDVVALVEKVGALAQENKQLREVVEQYRRTIERQAQIEAEREYAIEEQCRKTIENMSFRYVGV